MRKKIIVLIPLILFNMLFLSSCWNYREVDNLVIIAGIAIDKNKDNNKYAVTFETLKIGGGKESKIEPDTLESDGDSIFDAIRNATKITGKKLYWSHAETVVISQTVAKEGIVPILDILGREPEPRLNLMLLISKEETAKEVLTKKSSSSDITSFTINKMVKASSDNTQTTTSELYKTIDNIGSEGISVAIPTVSKIKNMEKETLEVTGTSVFLKDKLVGFLSDFETKPLLYAKDEVKGGLIYCKVKTDTGDAGVTLEVDKSKTKIKPKYTDGKIVINLDVDTDVIIAELDSTEDLLDEKGVKAIQEMAQQTIENSIMNVIKKVQNEYDSDIFGFGQSVKDSIPSHWREVSADWDNYFKTLEVNVKSKVNIKGSAETETPIKVGG